VNGENIEARARALMERLDREAEAGGYHLNPDPEMTLDLCRGLVRNADRYGYVSCPCRLAFGNKETDLDIICPCDYRDPDLTEYGACYCALYVSREIKTGKKQASSIPERRPPPDQRVKPADQSVTGKIKVWRCRVCGYLCARESPPDVCPVCKAKKERFEPFLLSG